MTADRLFVFFLLLSAGPAVRLSAQQAPPGKQVYDKWCTGCHGDTGAGDGEAAERMLPRPRDFTRGVYQIRTTASGELPMDQDIRHVVEDGMPGTAMPEWKSRLTSEELEAVVAYVKTFSRDFQDATPQPIALGKAPGSSDAGITEGREIYRKLECFKCHGQAGRGDGKSAPTLTDDWDHPIRAADLTHSWNFNGGAMVEQIYARLRTGLDGTPMPSFSDVIESKLITDEQLWRVAQYVRSLSPAEPPPVREVIRAGLVQEGTLPSGPADSGWVRAERFYVPLVGQIIQKPRWFIPTVNGLFVQALHDGKSLAIRLSWHDPSKSPDRAWDEWLARIDSLMGDTTTVLRHGPDQMVVQFPLKLTDDGELPYFLQGSTRRPAHLWRWSSTPDSLEVGSATGLGRFVPRAGPISHVALFDNGEWQLQLTRALVPADSANAPVFAPGRTVPIGFFAADGSSGEDLVRGSISAWYSIYLDVPVPMRVYVQPVVAVLLTAGLGLLVVVRAQRRERRTGGNNLEAQ